MAQRNTNSANPLGSISAIIGLIIFFVVAYYLLSAVLSFFAWIVAPVLLLITAFIDYTVITDFVKWIFNLSSRNWIYALVALAVILGLYFLSFDLLINALLSSVSAFLFGKALFKQKIKSVKEKFEEREKGEFVEYEEVETEIHDVTETTDEIETLELEPPPKPKPIKETRQANNQGGNEYDNLFE